MISIRGLSEVTTENEGFGPRDDGSERPVSRIDII